MKNRIAIASFILACTGAALAQTPPIDATATPRVDQRQARQQQRIDQGVASGQLTAQETARLEKGQAHVAGAEARAKADGTVTAKERTHLAHMQNKQSRHIARQKHDHQTAH